MKRINLDERVDHEFLERRASVTAIEPLYRYNCSFWYRSPSKKTPISIPSCEDFFPREKKLGDNKTPILFIAFIRRKSMELAVNDTDNEQNQYRDDRDSD